MSLLLGWQTAISAQYEDISSKNMYLNWKSSDPEVRMCLYFRPVHLLDNSDVWTVDVSACSCRSATICGSAYWWQIFCTREAADVDRCTLCSFSFDCENFIFFIYPLKRHLKAVINVDVVVVRYYGATTYCYFVSLCTSHT